MKAVADICVVPLTGRVSVRAEVAKAHQVLIDSGLPVRLHGYGTNIEGELGAVLDAVKRVHEVLHAAGVPRISTNLRLGTRIDKEPGLQAKIDAVRDELARG